MKQLRLPIHILSRSNFVLGSKTAIIVVATLAIFYQDLAVIVTDALQSEFMSHVLAVPFLFCYLIYRKRKMIKASILFEPSPSHRGTLPYREIEGMLLFLIAFLTYSYGSYTFTPLEFHLFALPIFVAACSLVMFNVMSLRQLAFPILFLFFLTPMPIQILYGAGAILSTFSSQASYSILKTLGLPVSIAIQYGSPTIILQKTGSLPLTFAIDIACSGIYSLIGFMIFAIFIAYIARTSLWKKATIFTIGFPLIYALNILRITIIVLVGDYSGMEIALQTFHLLGGWFLIFVGTLLLLVVSERLLRIQLFTTKSDLASCNYCNQNTENKQQFCPACGKFPSPRNNRLSKLDLSKIAIVSIIVVLIINLQAPVFTLTKGPAEVSIQTLGGEQTVAQILPEIPGYAAKFIYRDKRFEEISRQDASLAYAYFPANTTEKTVWVTIEIAKTRSSLHSWEACLIAWPQYRQEPYATQLSLRYVQILPNPPVIASYFAFQDVRTNLTQAVLYWYENAFLNTGLDIEQRYVKISLIAFPDNTEEIASTEDKLLPLGKAIVSYWQPIKIWSQITLVISQKAIALIAITVTSLAIVLTYQAARNLEEKRSNLRIYKKLALEEEKLLLRATYEADRQNGATGNAIALHYQKLAEKPIEIEMLIKKLKEAEEAGLISKELANKGDEPILIWKTRMAFPKSSVIKEFAERLIRTLKRKHENVKRFTKIVDE